VKLKVKGMTCDGCARSVSRAIANKDPAAKIAVDLATGWVAIEGMIEPAAARAAVTEAGYKVVDTR
jgi:copper chaperone